MPSLKRPLVDGDTSPSAKHRRSTRSKNAAYHPAQPPRPSPPPPPPLSLSPLVSVADAMPWSVPGRSITWCVSASETSTTSPGPRQSSDPRVIVSYSVPICLLIAGYAVGLPEPIIDFRRVDPDSREWIDHQDAAVKKLGTYVALAMGGTGTITRATFTDSSKFCLSMGPSKLNPFIATILDGRPHYDLRYCDRHTVLRCAIAVQNTILIQKMLGVLEPGECFLAVLREATQPIVQLVRESRLYLSSEVSDHEIIVYLTAHPHTRTGFRNIIRELVDRQAAFDYFLSRSAFEHSPQGWSWLMLNDEYTELFLDTTSTWAADAQRTRTVKDFKPTIQFLERGLVAARRFEQNYDGDHTCLRRDSFRHFRKYIQVAGQLSTSASKVEAARMHLARQPPVKMTAKYVQTIRHNLCTVIRDSLRRLARLILMDGVGADHAKLSVQASKPVSVEGMGTAVPHQVEIVINLWKVSPWEEQEVDRRIASCLSIDRTDVIITVRRH